MATRRHISRAALVAGVRIVAMAAITTVASEATADRVTPAPPPKQDDIARVIHANNQRIHLCYQRAVLRDPTLPAGEIALTLRIGLSGKVIDVVQRGPTPLLTLEPCIREVVSRWVFPRSPIRYVTTVPVILRLHDEDGDEAEGDCSMVVDSRPSSDLWIDGKPTGRQTPYLGTIVCGKHTLTFKSPDRQLVRTETIIVQQGKRFHKVFGLAEPD